MSKPFCAICVEPIVGTIHQEPIGKGDAIVTVCSACATHPVRARYSERGYEPKGAPLNPEELTAAMRRVMGARYEAENERIHQVGRAPVPALGEDDWRHRDHIRETCRGWRTGANAHNSKERRGARARRER